MRILLISGFLGSGKTTLALELARLLVEQEKRIAAVINEVGDVGIDPDLFRDRDEVRLYELFSGCVCCQTSSDLIKTLQAITNAGNVDVLVLEPSGIALSSQIIDTIRYWSAEVPVVNVVLVDATRFQMLMKELEHLITDALMNADLIVVSKVDLCGDGELQSVLERIRELRPEIPVVAGNLLSRGDKAARRCFSELDSHPCASDFHVSVASRRIKLDGAFDFTAEQWSEFVLALLGRMRSRLNNGKLFLGHIKASLEVDRGLIFGSTTGGAAAIKFSEAPIPKSSKALLKTALIAYKIDQGSLENCLLQALDETSQEYGLTYQVEQQEKEEEYL